MKDVTKKYLNMIESFECDFALAKEEKERLIYLQQSIDNKESNLLKDISLLEELSFELRHGNLKIMEVNK